VRVFWLVLLFSSCVANRGNDTNPLKNTQENKDWLKIYEEELRIAKENNDAEAWSFFFREYLLEIKNKAKK
tara:strand:- start:329 stop:541 length:213 start_codon:yes stop_codon:yes gene_type:complete